MREEIEIESIARVDTLISYGMDPMDTREEDPIGYTLNNDVFVGFQFV